MPCRYRRTLGSTRARQEPPPRPATLMTHAPAGKVTPGRGLKGARQAADGRAARQQPVDGECARRSPTDRSHSPTGREPGATVMCARARAVPSRAARGPSCRMACATGTAVTPIWYDERPAGRVVGRNRRSTRVRAQVRDSAARSSRSFANGRNGCASSTTCVPAGYVTPSAVNGARRAVHLDAALHQRLDERHARRARSCCGGGNDVGHRRFGPALRDLPRADLVDAVEQLLAVLRRDVEDGQRARSACNRRRRAGAACRPSTGFG